MSEQPAGVLTSVVGVQDRPRGGSALPAGHVESVDDEFGADVVGDRPADDPSGPGIHDRAAIDPAVGSSVLSDVGEPEPIRAIGMELALDQVVMGCRGRDMSLLATVTHALELVFAHEPSDPLPSAGKAHVKCEFGMNPRRPIGSPRHHMDLTDREHQLPISQLPAARLSVLPLIEA